MLKQDEGSQATDRNMTYAGSQSAASTCSMTYTPSMLLTISHQFQVGVKYTISRKQI